MENVPLWLTAVCMIGSSIVAALGTLFLRVRKHDDTTKDKREVSALVEYKEASRIAFENYKSSQMLAFDIVKEQLVGVNEKLEDVHKDHRKCQKEWAESRGLIKFLNLKVDKLEAQLKTYGSSLSGGV